MKGLKNKKSLAVLISVFLLIFIISFVNKNMQINKIEDQVHTYLLEKGYKASDIAKVEGYRNYSGSKVSSYHAIVYFTDEPKADYNYTRDDKTGKISQSSWYGDGFHKEKK
jgi:hypothetical protein